MEFDGREARRRLDHGTKAVVGKRARRRSGATTMRSATAPVRAGGRSASWAIVVCKAEEKHCVSRQIRKGGRETSEGKGGRRVRVRARRTR